MLHRFLPKLALLVFGSLLGLGVLEFAVRRFLNVYECRPERGWGYIPNKTGQKVTRSGEFNHPLPINGLGMHDVERTFARAPGVFRVLIVGDSFTAASHVPLADTFAQVAERALAAQTLPGRRIEAWNAGVDGYGTPQEAAWLEELLPKVKPDLVLLGFFGSNDFDDTDAILGNGNHYLAHRCSRPYFVADAAGVHRDAAAEARIGAAVPWQRRWFGHSLLWSTLLDGADRSMAERFDTNAVFRPVWTARLTGARLAVAGLVGQMRDRVRAAGVPFAALYLPASPETRSGGLKPPAFDRTQLSRRALAMFREVGVETFDLLPVLDAAIARGAAPYWRTDSHWNQVGNAVVGEALAQWLTGKCHAFGLPVRCD